uniref:Uncharacterized protein n=1 Tax=Oryza brachyantha TaxID=4533 RepID=J3N4E5_ORYBR
MAGWLAGWLPHFPRCRDGEGSAPELEGIRVGEAEAEAEARVGVSDCPPCLRAPGCLSVLPAVEERREENPTREWADTRMGRAVVCLCQARAWASG